MTVADQDYDTDDYLPPAIPLPDLSGAACADVDDPDIFYSTVGHEISAAVLICVSCPVQAVCLDYAVQAEPYGVWGGRTEDQRRGMRRERPVQPAAERRPSRPRITEPTSPGGRPTLTVRQVREIRAVPPYTGRTDDLVARYGISRSTVADVLSRRTWREVSA
jgi:hypothetical protein